MRSVTPKDPVQLHLPLPEGYEMFARRMTQSLRELGQAPEGGWPPPPTAKTRTRPRPGLMGPWRWERR